MSLTELIARAICLWQFKLTGEDQLVLHQFPIWNNSYTQDEPFTYILRDTLEIIYTKDRVDFKPVPGKGGRISGNYTEQCGLWIQIGSAGARICEEETIGTDENGKVFHYRRQ